MIIDAVATEKHYLDHLKPVFDALPVEVRGEIFNTKQKVKVEPTITLAASFKDLQIARHRSRPVILMEHGAGQSYVENNSQAYVGASDRYGVLGVLVPNRAAALQHATAHPQIPFSIVGCPKLDGMLNRPAPERGVAAISFHWDCRVCPETRSAMPFYEKELQHLAAELPQTLGHAHPRMWMRAEQAYRRAGMHTTPRFDDVVREASVYACDNSSTLFEFAALGRPVVVLNAPWFRRDVEHGGRFWEWSEIGENVDASADLVPAIQRALDDPECFSTRRAEITGEIYPHQGRSAELAAESVCEFAERASKTLIAVS